MYLYVTVRGYLPSSNYKVQQNFRLYQVRQYGLVVRHSACKQFSSVQDDICMLGKDHMCSTPSLRSFSCVALETVPALLVSRQIQVQFHFSLPCSSQLMKWLTLLPILMQNHSSGNSVASGVASLYPYLWDLHPCQCLPGGNSALNKSNNKCIKMAGAVQHFFPHRLHVENLPCSVALGLIIQGSITN